VEKERIVSDFKQMLESGVFIDPLLVHTYFRDESSELMLEANQHVERLFLRYVHLEVFAPALKDIPYTSEFMRMGLRDAILSTAVAMTYADAGSLEWTPQSVRSAATRVSKCIAQCGVHRFYILYFVITGHDVMQPLVWHKNLPESEYLDGTRHHPYDSHTLEYFLIIALARRSIRLKVTGNQRVIQLTKRGAERHRWYGEMLDESGYNDKRIAHSYVYQFDTVEDWDEMCRIVWPDSNDLRKEYVQWLNIWPGAHVLEVGCGTGALTFEGQLYKAVGGTGQLTAIDVSSGMLEQGRRKFEDFGHPSQVDFAQASAEHLPFADGVFNFSIGSAFLHFTDGKRALSEMMRTVAPGGTVSILQGLEMEMDQPFFQDWFEPIFDLARRRNAHKPHSYLPHKQRLISWFKEVGLLNIEYLETVSMWVFDDPEIVVQHLVRGISFFQREIMMLPWDDRKTLISELIDRGRDVRRKYPNSERIIQIPSIMLKGRRPDGL
jgi:ubiquinone/menaquinone biosynthesis C-methylase UbiE